MNLTAYSDSDSDGDAPPSAKPAPKPAPKPSFTKVVDRANPGRIKVSLPGALHTHTQPRDDLQDDAPPAKKPRLGAGGGLGGLNAMLPAPKKPSPSATPVTSGGASGARGLGKALASGVNLKTGAEPAFKRAPKLNLDEYDEDGNPLKTEPMSKDDFRAMLNLPAPKTDGKPVQAIEANQGGPPAEPAPPRFVPMSVGKGRQKKKPAVSRSAGNSGDKSTALGSAPSKSQPLLEQVQPVRKPKVSLFGVTQEAEPSRQAPSSGSYQPLLYGVADGGDAAIPDEAFELQSHHTQHPPIPVVASSSGALTNIASELNLSESERRQLFGKQGKGGPDFSSANIVEFNTDTEYAHNEKLRRQGEQVQHNALKSISGTGKNSLRSLVSAAVTQKDALEDHFAASHRNKREAGNKYGW